ncbi:MAG: hypothetical protein A2365_01205 [Candidatus Nealsonbacteria bacterium RIFOXYB1_FULL_40_15]|uniref:Lactamase n=2 Tax=Candidatus Nealsoniibacteriota TaxID=1817911 RepID=A0A1G2EM56_9BACT|nr:MAG: hypothetical protein A2427_04735 [Candidatus Nealsonbacteria bacterium RIFOXYC1_FULL_40_7]OGZ26888.1 MAG: hypothetical protein A2365_01205 [Candidatus Nealsonbacteria bacterium RIFOXYB1_FULL_40_15]
MTISWFGQTCFKITASMAKSEQVNIIIDPPAKDSGIKGPKLDSDILIAKKAPQGEYFLIDTPGEFDVKDVFVQGIGAKGSTVYVIKTEGLKLCHLGKIDQEELSSSQLEEIGDVDILLVPVGGEDSLDAKKASAIMSQIEPKITIPMNYSAAGSKEKLDKVDLFLKILGIEKVKAIPKLAIKEKDIPKEDEAKIIVLEQ